MLNKYNNIFLKMDIEGYEIPWFETLNQEQMDKLCQIAIEFHSPFSERENAIFRKLNNTHVLIHFHGNNCCGVKTVQGVDIPNVFECTYIHKKYFSLPKQLNISQVPSLLDQPNLVSKPEIYLNYKPFNNLS